jgi:hypothetical protein
MKGNFLGLGIRVLGVDQPGKKNLPRRFSLGGADDNNRFDANRRVFGRFPEAQRK